MGENIGINLTEKERVTRGFGFCRPVLVTLPESPILVLHFPVDVKRLWELGKGYSWPSVRECPACGGRGCGAMDTSHAGFEGFADFRVKRYRCPECSAVHTSRPSGFLRGSGTVPGRCFPLVSQGENGFVAFLGAVRQVQQYWYRSLRFFVFRSSFPGGCSASDIRSFFPPGERSGRFCTAAFVRGTPPSFAGRSVLGLGRGAKPKGGHDHGRRDEKRGGPGSGPG